MSRRIEHRGSPATLDAAALGQAIGDALASHTTPPVPPTPVTGSRGNGDALVNLLAALAARGIIVDATHP